MPCHEIKLAGAITSTSNHNTPSKKVHKGCTLNTCCNEANWKVVRQTSIRAKYVNEIYNLCFVINVGKLIGDTITKGSQKVELCEVSGLEYAIQKTSEDLLSLSVMG